MKISELKSHGLTVELKKGNLHIGGFKTLPPDVAARVRQAVAEHRDTIIAELTTAPDAASLPQVVAGHKPCDSTPGLPCLGEQGTCFSRPYWEGKTFDDKNIRRKATELDTCPSAERVEQYISEPRDQIVAELAATEKPEDVQGTDAERAYLELVEQVSAGAIVMEEYQGGWLRPLLCAQIDALAVQDLFQRALPSLTTRYTDDGLRELRKAMTGQGDAVPQNEAPAHGKHIPASAWKSYRAAVAWLRPRLSELLAAGWTGKALFGLGRHRFGCACCFGLAWRWAGLRAGWTPFLEPGGIRWKIEEHSRTVELWDRLQGAKK